MGNCQGRQKSVIDPSNPLIQSNKTNIEQAVKLNSGKENI